ncbi:MAG: cell envelope biogenesis protein OmpA [Betaproteobacteria bacterium HGW-Betaproteobacteria-4]|jgi:OOP family OmpA-OmpF porin|nr:MAG: cell envelope biogenesis protein OmpA [Betaproteobacteria bacterium HGW-Betaproteobacteria-4]
MNTMIRILILAMCSALQLGLGAGSVLAQEKTGEQGERVTVSGTVPDEASKVAILERLRSVYGAANVVDKLEVGGVVPPPNWTENMTKVLTDNLKQVHKGQMQVNGTHIAVKGNVANEALRQQVVSQMATSLNPTYSIDNALVAPSGEAQHVLDKTLANRVVEFESGSANLTPLGKAVLDEMYGAIRQIGTPKVMLVGHTDSQGGRPGNIALSLARANTVRTYLASKGIPAETLSASGVGPDQPVASNDTVEGRARNRRIEFKLVQK